MTYGQQNDMFREYKNSIVKKKSQDGNVIKDKLSKIKICFDLLKESH